ncbi:hypothetical protein COO59_12940 [Mixta theicola]|uniref:Tlde1 domain-containing protein n=1 Tax=Mixta theicola TaxID=1458355 RepID=A0A2K1Q814_9GAMM|nr:DUF2778 domain-containing protein [Mixta theicola]PNS11174.1 hypothetical protein COO59_12940 [Mixta theicola]
MALYGRFVINDADFSPLIFNGIGTFMDFSGDGLYRNHGGCSIIPGSGPIPTGKYWIVDRPAGGVWSKTRAWIKDFTNIVFSNAEFMRSEWFALYRDDGKIVDYTWIKGVERKHFRLHPGSVSWGCITLVRNTHYALLRNELLRTRKMPVPGRSGLMAYGTIEVIHHARICP